MDADPDVDMATAPTTSTPLADTTDPDFDILNAEDDADLGLDGIDEHRVDANGVNGTSATANGLGGSDGARDAEKTLFAEATALEEAEARVPVKKDISLREFLGKMDEYAPIVCLSFPQPTSPLPTPH